MTIAGTCSNSAEALMKHAYTKRAGKVYPQTLTTEEIVVRSPCLYADVDKAVEACCSAQKEFQTVSLSVRQAIVSDIRFVSNELADEFALWAISETKRGNFDDKVSKQHLAANKTPGPEDIQPKIVSGDLGVTLHQYAPYGVFAAVTPVTNPTATIIHNTICMVSAGNGICFNAHPGAVACTNRVVAIINEIIKAHGGPCSLVCAIETPTIASGQALLNHPNTHANLVTGGPAVVKVALKAGKKCFCAGPGNPPVVVDETANIPKAAQAIYAGASFDNNMICSDEKEVFCVTQVYDQLIKEFEKCGAYIATPEDIKILEAKCLKEPVPLFTHGTVDAALVGQPAAKLMHDLLGKTPANGDKCRLIICPVPDGHQFVYTELLMPIIPVVKVPNFDTAVACAVKAEHGYRHTSSIYTSDINHITKMGKLVNTTIFTINGNHLAGLACGGEGYTSFSITGFTGEGMTRPSTFVRERRIVCVDSLNVV